MRRILLFSVPIVVAALLALLVVSRQSKSGDTLKGVVTNDNRTTMQQQVNQNQNAAVAAIESTQTAVRTVSRQFAERYSTTSSLTPTSNLTAVLPFTTTALTQAFQRTIASPPAPAAESVVTTSHAFAFNIQNLDEKLGRATVVVSLQRSERKGNAADKKYQQDLSLQLIRENGVWKVNFAVFSKV